MKKLVIVRYLGYSSETRDYCCVSKDYGYFINTKKQIKEGDFICIGTFTSDEMRNGVNEDRCVVSVVRVKKVIDDYDHNIEKANDLIGGLSKSPIYKELLGKADLAGYFAEIDKKRKIEELQERIEKRFKEAEKEALYRKLAETDPQMKELLAELDSLK